MWGQLPPRLSSGRSPAISRDSAHLATASDDGLRLRCLKWVVIPRRVLSRVSPRLGTSHPQVLFPVGRRFETLRGWECYGAEPGRIPPARFASIRSPTSATGATTSH